MIVAIEKTGKTHELEFQGSASALLNHLDINPITVIIAADRKLIPLDADVSAAKRIDILSVVSGG